MAHSLHAATNQANGFRFIRMRVLLISPFPPHPDADHGGGVYLGLLTRELVRHAEVAVVCYAHGDDREPLPGIRWYTTARRRRSELGAFQRLRQQLRYLWDWGVRGTPLEVAKQKSTAFRRLLRRARAEFQPDVVLVEFMVMAWCLDELEDCTTVLTDHERGESVPRRFGPGNLGATRDRRLWPRYVRHFYPKADLCQCMTPEDAAAVRESTGLPIELRSPMIDLPASPARPAVTGQVMVFFGDYLHHPNSQAAERLAREVLPAVRATIPDAELWLVGPRAPAQVTSLGEVPGVRILGFVEDLAAVLAQARCFVGPVYSGHGVRTKALHAMAHGLPVVTNQLGLQGISPPAAAIAVGETPRELAAAAAGFLSDPDAAQRAGIAAREFIAETYRVEDLVQHQLARFEALRS